MTAATEKPLSRRIAELLGWQFIYAYSSPEPDGSYTDYYWIAKPDGTYLECDDSTDGEFPEHAIQNLIPDYPHDLNACARDLMVEGWIFSIKQWVEVGKPNSWLAEYYNNTRARGVGHWGDIPAVAWCEAFIALDKYIKESKS